MEGLSMPVSAYVLIQAKPGTSRTVVEAASRIEGVTAAHAVTGLYDVIAQVQASDVAVLSDLVISRIQSIEGVERTHTAVTVFPVPVARVAKPRTYKNPPPPKNLVEESVRAIVARDPSLAGKPIDVLRQVRAVVKQKGYRAAIAPRQIEAILRKSR